jgi:hypothetical protein
MKSLCIAGIPAPRRCPPAKNVYIGRTMKTAKTAIASSIALAMAFGTAQAEICYKLTPFPDVIRLAQMTVQDEAAGGSHTLVFGNWTAGVGPSKPVVGSLDVSVDPSGTRLGLHGTLHGGDCAGHSDVTLDGIPGGPWALSCDGGAAGVFNNSGTLTVISCDTLSTLTTAEAGKSATQQ